MHFRADEGFQLSFTLEEEVAANPRELVRPGLRHFERELPDVLSVDQTDSDLAHSASDSVALNFNCAARQSVCSTSVRSPRYTG